MLIKLYSFIDIMKIMGKGKPCFCLTATGLHIYFRYTSKRSFFGWSHLPDLAKIVYVYLYIHDSFFKKLSLCHDVTVGSTI